MRRRCCSVPFPFILASPCGVEPRPNLLVGQARRQAVWKGLINKTETGLSKSDLVKNKSGKIVSKKKSILSKESAWIIAVRAARAELGDRSFGVKKGSPLYIKAKATLALLMEIEFYMSEIRHERLIIFP